MKVVYRELPNKNANDFNNEPQTIREKYFVVGESKDGKKWLVERAGWQGKRNRHYIDKIQGE